MGQAATQELDEEAEEHDRKVIMTVEVSGSFQGKLGIAFGQDTGDVVEVFDGQGKDFGVQAGWRIIRIDGVPFTANLFKRKISGTAPFQVTFLKKLLTDQKKAHYNGPEESAFLTDLKRQLPSSESKDASAESRPEELSPRLKVPESFHLDVEDASAESGKEFPPRFQILTPQKGQVRSEASRSGGSATPGSSGATWPLGPVKATGNDDKTRDCMDNTKVGRSCGVANMGELCEPKVENERTSFQPVGIPPDPPRDLLR